MRSDSAERSPLHAAGDGRWSPYCRLAPARLFPRLGEDCSQAPASDCLRRHSAGFPSIPSWSARSQSSAEAVWQLQIETSSCTLSKVCERHHPYSFRNHEIHGKCLKLSFMFLQWSGDRRKSTSPKRIVVLPLLVRRWLRRRAQGKNRAGRHTCRKGQAKEHTTSA